jgi:hypothetical protein
MDLLSNSIINVYLNQKRFSLVYGMYTSLRLIQQLAGWDEKPEKARWALIQLSFMQMSMGSQRARIWLMGTQ